MARSEMVERTSFQTQISQVDEALRHSALAYVAANAVKSPDTDNNEDESRFDRNVVTGIIEKERKGVEGGGQERPKSPLAALSPPLTHKHNTSPYQAYSPSPFPPLPLAATFFVKSVSAVVREGLGGEW
eukprot:CAMPEP_0173120242 /NCGR_PEP_ID=MMETSP1102-20130122/52362_1 /TAXON_ID=49646 /ORGANISM="Geminigera sp., Strain Caron Lab Isolate" /LENGTH=128 /DNA_ID=CAMNT_0014026197 /DNA_START=201 /DNA_END=584 /DNA_ORIENTATION=-